MLPQVPRRGRSGAWLWCRDRMPRPAHRRRWRNACRPRSAPQPTARPTGSACASAYWSRGPRSSAPIQRPPRRSTARSPKNGA